jgi:hypothetical protein
MGIGILELIIVLGVLGLAGALVVGLVLLFATRRPSGLAVNNPNLRPCPDCGQLISVRAAACPHCGGPVKGA